MGIKSLLCVGDHAKHLRDVVTFDLQSNAVVNKLPILQTIKLRLGAVKKSLPEVTQ